MMLKNEEEFTCHFDLARDNGVVIERVRVRNRLCQKFESKSSEDERKGNPAISGGLLTSKPTWSNSSGYSTTPAFFFACCVGEG